MPIGIGYESMTLRAARRGRNIYWRKMSLSHRFGLKNCNKTLLPGWEEAREHMLATQPHNTIYLAWIAS